MPLPFRPVLTRAKEPVALLVDQLLGLGDRELDRLIAARMRLGAAEPLLFEFAADLLLDAAGGLVGAPARIRRRAAAVALVLDRRGRGTLGAAAAGQPRPQGFQHRGHRAEPAL